MLQPMNRRRFLQALGAGALILSRAVPTRAAAQGDRLVVAVGQWGIETPGYPLKAGQWGVGQVR